MASQNVKFEICNILFLTQSVVAKINSVTSPESSGDWTFQPLTFQPPTFQPPTFQPPIKADLPRLYCNG